MQIEYFFLQNSTMQNYFQLQMLGAASTAPHWSKSAANTLPSQLSISSMSFFAFFLAYLQPLVTLQWWSIKLLRLSFCFAYLDNIIIYSRTEKQHLKHLWKVFNWLQGKYYTQINKIWLFQSSSTLPRTPAFTNRHIWLARENAHN